MSWSSGKDSAWALYQLQQNPEYEVAGLFTTVNQAFNRVAMHGVRLQLLHQQAACLGLKLIVINIPFPCSNQDYQSIMAEFVADAKQQQVDCFAFGDLFLEDIRQYRLDQLKETGIDAVFPIWGIPTDQLAQEMIDSGLKARVTCVDPKQAFAEIAGREFNHAFISSLPDTVDPCGENGEFHSFVYDGPMFNQAVSIQSGQVIERDGFIFADLMPVD